jgi:hypothetical protein
VNAVALRCHQIKPPEAVELLRLQVQTAGYRFSSDELRLNLLNFLVHFLLMQTSIPGAWSLNNSDGAVGGGG